MARIRGIRTLSELESIESLWKKIEGIDEGTSIFQSWNWNHTWCNIVLGKRKNAELAVRIVEDDAGRTLAILPFFEEPLLGPVARLSQFLGHRLSYHNDILLADPRNSDWTAQVIAAMTEGLQSKDILHLRHLYDSSPFTKRLLAAGLAEPQCTRVWVAKDSTMPDPFMRLGATTRKSLRQQMKRLRRGFDVEVHVVSGVEFPAAFDALVDLHNRRFSSMGRTSHLALQSAEFYRGIGSLLGEVGQAEIIQLRANGMTIAANLMIVDRRRYFSIQGAFDPEFARFSPSRMLDGETMRRGFDDLGCEIYDFGPGYEGYKLHWRPVIGMNYMSCIGGSGAYTKCIAAVYQAQFRRRVRRSQAASHAASTPLRTE